MNGPARYWSNLKDDGTGQLSARTDADCPVYRCAGPCMGLDAGLGPGEDIRCAGCNGVGMSQSDWHERKAERDAACARERQERAAQPSLWQRLIGKVRRKNADHPSASID